MKDDLIKFLSEISDILNINIDIYEFQTNLNNILNKYTQALDTNFYVFDTVTGTLRDCVNNWTIVEDTSDLYKNFIDVKNNDFVMNQKAYKLPSVISDILFEIDSLNIPIIRDSEVFGLIQISFEKNTSISMEYLVIMKILAAEISLKIQNIVLKEQSKINVEFHDSMKNIAKIIETQYELNYIVPLIGEMLDRFISDHLIYIFLKEDENYNLIWPKACNDERVYNVLKQLSPETEYILTNNDKIGAFPLLSENEIIGCVVARSTLDTLSKRDIGYLEQLSRQSAITISRANSYSKILQYATIDALTNLNNRRQFEIRLKQEIAIAKRQKNPLCAMMIDIDFFKKVNDTYGHACGDTVLREVASVIKQVLRESDIPARYGGEEFAVLLPFTNIRDAKVVGERLRKSVEKAVIPTNTENNKVQTIGVTISMGLAEFSTTETGEELFKRADKALYEAKESGRNRICIN